MSSKTNKLGEMASSSPILTKGKKKSAHSSHIVKLQHKKLVPAFLTNKHNIHKCTIEAL